MSKKPTDNVKMVLEGQFPKESVKKMNRQALENFVMKLVECSTNEGAKSAKDFTGLYRSLCLKKINKPEWWPSERIIEQSLTADGRFFMHVLRFLVYKCCEFFRKPNNSLNDKLFVNDENSRGTKRTRSDSDSCEAPAAKRRTLRPRNGALSPKNVSPVFKEPIIKLTDILRVAKPKPLTQDQFLSNFGLHSTHYSSLDEPLVPHPSTSNPIRFHTCSIIPFSSDLGQILMKRENHFIPEYSKTRRLERIEWYVNQTVPRYTETHYCVSYQDKLSSSAFHTFKFPRRQLSQLPGDVEAQKALLCKPLRVVLVPQDLDALKTAFWGVGRHLRPRDKRKEDAPPEPNLVNVSG